MKQSVCEKQDERRPFAADAAGEQRTRIIYIHSIGHSGSTLLDMLIQSHEDVVSVGEVKKLRSKYDQKCTCPAPSMSACPFWSAVEAHLLQYDRLRLNELDILTDDPQRFERDNVALFRAVRAVSGKRFIVDSSKSPSRMFKLLTVDAFDVQIIHLERNPFGVVYSKLKKGRNLPIIAKDVANSMIRSRLSLVQYPRILVEYEKLARDPRNQLRRIMEYLGLEFQEQQLEWASRVRHNVGGNKIRRSTDSTIRLDTAWRHSLSRWQKARIALILAGLAAIQPCRTVRSMLSTRTHNCTTIDTELKWKDPPAQEKVRR